MLSFKKLATALFLLIGISCSIVKDSDVTSIDQLTKLKLSSISIVQNLSGINSAGTASVRDSTFKPVAVKIDIDTLITDSVAKHTIITWPVFANTKLLFKSKISGAGIVIRNSFYKNGKVRYTRVYQNNLQKEYYSFYYDKNWKLTDIRSRIYISTPSIDTTVIRDTYTYNTSGYIATMLRTFQKSTPSKSPVTITFAYQQYGSNPDKQLGGNSFSYGGYTYFYSNCNCPNNSGNACSGADAQANNSSARYIATGVQLSSIITQLKIDDIKNTGGNCGGSGGPSDYDTYYFQPLMLLRGLFTHGDILFNIYAIDWWQPGAQIGSNPSLNQSVTFNFNYVR